MGCGGSVPERDAEPTPPPQVTYVGSTKNPSGDPPPYRHVAWGQSQRAPGSYLQPGDYRHSPEPDRSTLVNALDHIGQYLDQRRVLVCAVTAGGLVNTIYLRTKDATRDTNFFTDNPNSHATWELVQAAVSAAHASGGARGVPLKEGWLTNASEIVRDRGLENRLMMEAQQQNTIVYQYRGQHGGLILYAAPWQYVFCGKLERLCKSNQTLQDANDAVLYLHEYLRSKHRRGVSTSEIAKWCHEYGKIVTDAAIHHVNIQYFHIYGETVIYR